MSPEPVSLTSIRVGGKFNSLLQNWLGPAGKPTSSPLSVRLAPATTKLGVLVLSPRRVLGAFVLRRAGREWMNGADCALAAYPERQANAIDGGTEAPYTMDDRER